MSNKAKSRQSSRSKKNYEVQRIRTAANKARRAKARQKKANSAATLRRREQRHARNLAKGIPRVERLRREREAARLAAQKARNTKVEAVTIADESSVLETLAAHTD